MGYIKKHKEMLFVAAAFLFFFLFSCYKLTEGPLWYDETLEFYFSRIFKGPIENVTDLNSLYERLIYYSFQPPLYHLVMSVWLLFSEAEWWYRFSCVIFGLISAAGLYKAIAWKKGRRVGALSVVLYPLLYEIMYYFRECAEYALLLSFLTWTVYFYFRALEEDDNKWLILFTLFCILDVYTQYGAAFVIAPMAVSVLLEKWIKNRQKLKLLLPAYGIAVIGAGIPLYWWFIRLQLGVQEGVATRHTVEFLKGNIIYDFFKNLSEVFAWCLIDSESIERFEPLTALLLAGMLVLSVFVFIKGKNRSLNHLLVSNIFGWVFYYVLVKLNIYAYGAVANRYNIFFVPIWFLTMVLVAFESVRIVKEQVSKKWIMWGLVMALGMSTVFVVALNLRKMPHVFEKGHTREVVDLWYEREGYENFTYVCFGENVSFEYYLTHNENFKEEYKDNIYMEIWTVEKTEEEYLAFIKEQCGGEMPEELYVSTGNKFEVIEALEHVGYTAEILYQTNTTLYRVYR